MTHSRPGAPEETDATGYTGSDAIVSDAVREAVDRIVALSRWIDAGNVDRDPETLNWIRLSKVSEEAGEVISALTAATGANPRKGVCGSMTAVDKELLDVALTALAAFEHTNGHMGFSLAALFAHIQAVHERAGLTDPTR